MDTPFEQPYRDIILGKVRRQPLRILSSPYFEHMKPGTFAEVMGQILPKVPDEVGWEGVWRWAKAECGRKAKPITRSTVISIIPNEVKVGTDAGKVLERFFKLVNLEKETLPTGSVISIQIQWSPDVVNLEGECKLSRFYLLYLEVYYSRTNLTRKLVPR